jgi:hypothetical protein
MDTKTISTWILIVSSLMSLLGLFVGCSLYLTPGKFIPDADFTSSGARYLAHMWAARQITLGSIIGYSTFRKSIPMLQISLAAYSIMNVQDALIGVSRGDHGLIVGATIFIFIPAYMVWRLTQLEIKQ